MLGMLVLQWGMDNGPEKNPHMFEISNTLTLMAKVTGNLLQAPRAFVLIYLMRNAMD